MDQWAKLNRTHVLTLPGLLEPAGAGDRPTRKGLPLSPNSDLQVRSQKGLQRPLSPLCSVLVELPALGGKRPLSNQVPRDAPGPCPPPSVLFEVYLLEWTLVEKSRLSPGMGSLQWLLLGRL